MCGEQVADVISACEKGWTTVPGKFCSKRSISTPPLPTRNAQWFHIAEDDDEDDDVSSNNVVDDDDEDLEYVSTVQYIDMRVPKKAVS
eukprot:1317082-Karenia_brevis.AAC.1